MTKYMVFIGFITAVGCSPEGKVANNRVAETNVSIHRGFDQKIADAEATAGATQTPGTTVGDKKDKPLDPENDKKITRLSTLSHDIALAYTGNQLAYQYCDKESGHLNEYMTQERLLKTFQGAKNWWEDGLGSLEEHDKTNVNRPFSATHSNLVHRLALGKNPAVWDLIGVRIRFGDVTHVKLAYEMSIPHTNPSFDIGYAGFIHAIAIPDDKKEDFTADVNEIPQDENRSGCAIKRLLDKWVLKTGSYWFLHTNILDIKRNDWVWTELKVVEGDVQPIKTGCADSRGCAMMKEELLRQLNWRISEKEFELTHFRMTKDQLTKKNPDELNDEELDAYLQTLSSVSGWSGYMAYNELQMIKSDIMMYEYYAMTDPSAASYVKIQKESLKTKYQQLRVDIKNEIKRNQDHINRVTLEADKLKEEHATINLGPRKSNRAISDIFGNPAGQTNTTKTLRIVPMRFQKFTWDSTKKTIVAKAESFDLIKWFDTDKGKKDFRLVENEKGETLESTHPAYANEAAFTCAGCHVRQTLDRKGWATGGENLTFASHMAFRHIAYGGVLAHKAGRLGVRRAGYTATFSPYLQDSAVLRPTKDELSDKKPEPDLYPYLGDVKEKKADCSPYGGCECDRYRDYGLCLQDTTELGYLSDMVTIDFLIPTPKLRENALKHATKCVADAEKGWVSAAECDLLRCVLTQIDATTSLKINFSNAKAEVGFVNDPTFNCSLAPDLITPEIF